MNRSKMTNVHHPLESSTRGSGKIGPGDTHDSKLDLNKLLTLSTAIEHSADTSPSNFMPARS